MSSSFQNLSIFDIELNLSASLSSHFRLLASECKLPLIERATLKRVPFVMSSEKYRNLPVSLIKLTYFSKKNIYLSITITTSINIYYRLILTFKNALINLQQKELKMMIITPQTYSFSCPQSQNKELKS